MVVGMGVPHSLMINCTSEMSRRRDKENPNFEGVVHIDDLNVVGGRGKETFSSSRDLENW